MNSGDLNGILPAESDLCILRPGIEIKAGLQSVSPVDLGSFESLKSACLLLLYRSDKILVKYLVVLHAPVISNTHTKSKTELYCCVIQVSSNENAGVAGFWALISQMTFCSFQFCYTFFPY